jgi:hypothetical protein
MVKKLSVPSVRSSALQQQEVFAQASNPLLILETVEVSSASLEELGSLVVKAHKAFQSHLESALQAALIAGRALIAAREQFSYDRGVGGFRGWLSELGVSKSASYRYIDLAKHDAIVSQAGTLSEAMELVSQFKAEQRALNDSLSISTITKRRTTLSLDLEKDLKLERLAAERGIEVSSLISEIIERWLSRQKLPDSTEETTIKPN